MSVKIEAAAPLLGKLRRNPADPFEAFDEYGRPCLPMTIDDDTPTHGIAPGTHPLWEGGRISSTAGRTHDPALQQPWWLQPWEVRQPEGPDTGATLDDLLSMPVLPGPGSSSPSSTPNPFDMSGGGGTPAPCEGAVKKLAWANRSFGAEIAPQSDASPSKTDHPQQTIRIGDAQIEADALLARCLKGLNAIQCHTIASCEGTGKTVWAFIMFTESGGRAFAKLWRRRLVPLGYEQPVLDHELRGAGWRKEIGGDYPFPEPVPIDPDGINFTLIWKLYREKLEELMPHLLDALSCELQSQRHPGPAGARTPARP